MGCRNMEFACRQESQQLVHFKHGLDKTDADKLHRVTKFSALEIQNLELES